MFTSGIRLGYEISLRILHILTSFSGTLRTRRAPRDGPPAVGHPFGVPCYLHIASLGLARLKDARARTKSLFERIDEEMT